MVGPPLGGPGTPVVPAWGSRQGKRPVDGVLLSLSFAMPQSFAMPVSGCCGRLSGVPTHPPPTEDLLLSIYINPLPKVISIWWCLRSRYDTQGSRFKCLCLCSIAPFHRHSSNMWYSNRWSYYLPILWWCFEL